MNDRYLADGEKWGVWWLSKRGMKPFLSVYRRDNSFSSPLVGPLGVVCDSIRRGYDSW